MNQNGRNVEEISPSRTVGSLPLELGWVEVHWYALYTRSRFEKRIVQQLEAKSLEHFLPLYESVHRWKDRRARVSVPLFPGYVFVRMRLQDRLQVVSVPGVVSIVGVHGRPTPVRDEELNALRSCFAGQARLEPHRFLTIGRRARIINGPLADLEGILIRRKNGLRLVLSIQLIARSVAVEIDASDVMPLAPYPAPLPAPVPARPEALLAA